MFKWTTVAVVFTGIVLTLYCWRLSAQIEKRFSGRRWSIPSSIFSDITTLYPGQKINRILFHDKLKHLGYREVTYRPKQKGELRTSRSVLDIFLYDLKIPSRERTGFPVRIRFVQNRIESIAHLDSGDPVPILELEPEEVMSFFGAKRERRQLVSIEDVPQCLIYAILAAEDMRFYRHKGMDILAILRALYINLRHVAIRQGGSTITQQLAKNYFLTPKRTLSRKLKELLMSLTIEIMYDKDEILEIYLNEIYLGQKGSVSVNGVGEASHFYFGKPVSALSLVEAATIAGLIKSPNYYSPYADKKRSQDRGNVVLWAMHRNEWISDGELQTALSLPLDTVGFKAYGKKAPYFMDCLSAQLKTLYPPEALASLGLTIYTTLDTQVQTAAERALERGLARLEKSNPASNRPEPEKKLQGAVIVMQPKTGYVLAMVGGRNYSMSQFNRVTQALRQPGSAFKPFVFLSALDEFTPASMLSNEPKSYEVDGKLWEPQNYTEISEDRVNLRTALARSINLATVDLAMKLGIERIVSTVRRFRFSTPANPYPSLSLGAAEVIPLELARAYCPFAADGILPYPLLLKEVVDEDGKILERRHMAIERVISPAKAFIMTSMLKSVIEHGTGRSLHHRGISFPVGGKTGTTNDFKDAWFVGYTPDILALVWVGFDDGASIHTTGSSAALPIWADLMNAIPQYISGEWFKTPPGVVKRVVCPESGQLAVRFRCTKSVEEVFLADNVPKKDCPLHQHVSPLQQFMGRIKDLFTNF